MHCLHILVFGFLLGISSAFMDLSDFEKREELKHCERIRSFQSRDRNGLNSQDFPLPSSIETFVSLVERLERKNYKPSDIIRNLLMSFRCDGRPPEWDATVLIPRMGTETIWINDLQKFLFKIDRPDDKYLKSQEFTEEEQCSLHYMLSYTVNDTLQGVENEQQDDSGKAKNPVEYGVVSLNAKTKHAFSLSKVLLGILSAVEGATYEMDATSFERFPNMGNFKINRLAAVTIADVISIAFKAKSASERPNTKYEDYFLPNGLWDDAVCPTKYFLASRSEQRYASYSLLRGAIDGYILGKKMEEMKDLRISQILRMYYGPYGFPKDKDLKWCNRMELFRQLKDTGSSMTDEIINVYKLLLASNQGVISDEARLKEQVKNALNEISAIEDIFKEARDESSPECDQAKQLGQICETSSDIISILDYGSKSLVSTVLDVQRQIIGNLSVNFDMRHGGSSMGVYTNMKPLMRTAMLDSIVNITRVSGCPACFAKYKVYDRSPSKESEDEILRDLNSTLTQLVESYHADEYEQSSTTAPSKIVLYFNYGSPSYNYKIRDALWEIQKNFREVTILAVGTKKDSLNLFTDSSMDVFQDQGPPANLINMLKKRICQVPGEFQHKDCDRGSDNEVTHQGYISPGGVQYLAMYPKYFLKSFSITMRFTVENGAQIRVCYDRDYNNIIKNERKNSASAECRDSSSGAIEFTEKNPCHRYTEYECKPFYFYVEGRKAAETSSCTDAECKTSNQIRFEFHHTGISCNTASFMSVSPLALAIAVFISIYALVVRSY